MFYQQIEAYNREYRSDDSYQQLSLHISISDDEAHNRIVERHRYVVQCKYAGIWGRIDISSGRQISGTLRPSSDTNTHLELYRKWSSIGSIVHTHSTYATSWAQSAYPVTILGTTHADHLAGDIPCTEFMRDERINNDYETETGFQIIDCFEILNQTKRF